ncbi:DNA polymerase delta catalytic subunit [Coelomomyces lativittatus]|nr:DNA polymerase delta catalytic subunit [Coelomomyces lativittatus]
MLVVESPSSSWPRPNFEKTWDSQKMPLIFQQIEAEEHTELRPTSALSVSYPTSLNSQNVPTLLFYGITKEGHSVTCHVHGFFPYFYVPAPEGLAESHLPMVLQRLNNSMMQEKKSENEQIVLQIEFCLKESIMFFHGNMKSNFLKITLSHPKHIASCRRLFETNSFQLNTGSKAFQFSDLTYESNLAFLLRYMIDADITGMNWLELPPTKYLLRPKAHCISHAQLEVDVAYNHVISHAPVGPWSVMAPLRVLSFDIECAGRKGFFPDPHYDAVIQIANMVMYQGESQPFIRNVFTLNTCAHIVGSQVLSFDTEQELLSSWSQFIRQCDPDIVTGYNILNFDFYYLLERANVLKVHSFPYLGRLPAEKTVCKDSRFTSRAFGTRDSKAVNLEGRIIFDLLTLMTREHKLRSYSLNAVSAHFLNEQKEEVHYSMITELQEGNDETRRRLAVYCLKDAYLPLRLLNKLMCLIQYSEMARVTGVPFNFLLSRGQQIKVISQLFRKSKLHNVIVPAYRTGETVGAEDTFEGATVIEPERGYYNVPIATLDFSSLYPSIMMAHNLCYTTLVTKQVVEALQLQKDTDYIMTPTGDCFVKSHLRKGLLPEILEDLIGARKQVKKTLKNETDPFQKAVLDGRQLALKISANSVYGFTGATVGKLPCLEISGSVTGFGRVMIEKTKELVESFFTIQLGYPANAHVIYGDTDSVMVNFGVESLEKAMELGREAAIKVTQSFIQPIQLEFEKVYFPYLLINKKRYAGLYWTKTSQYDKMDCKGIETVRRDNCPLVAHLIDTCLRKILVEHNVEGAVTYVKSVISDLLQNKVDLSQLVITKALSKSDYAGKQAHVELADRMRKRDPGSAPNIGDRVAYVIVKGAKGAAAYEKAEDPIFVLENNLPIDTRYYLDNQLSKPLIRIFEPILGESTESTLCTSILFICFFFFFYFIQLIEIY